MYKLLKSILGRGYPEAKEVWESYFLSGRWNYLGQPEQLAHYSIIIGYFQYFKQGGSILDIGCGDGILQERLSPYAYSKYVGIDISDEIISRVSSRSDEKTLFIRADADNYIPDASFDAIVFNEVLYYFSSPLKTLGRYDCFLKKDGLFIVSMCLPKDVASVHNSIWKRLESKYILIDETKIINKRGSSWVCKVFRI